MQLSLKLKNDFLFVLHKCKEATNLRSLTGLVESVLVQRPNGDQIVGFEDRVARIESGGLRGGVHGDREALILTEGRGQWNAEKIAVEADGGRERRGDFEKRGERERGYFAGVRVRHHALDHAVIGNSIVP